MRIIAHRGLPASIDGVGSNLLADYQRAFERGLDVEMDVRYHGQEVLCSHEPIWPDKAYVRFEEFCELLKAFEMARAFVNVKCDGMTVAIRDIANRVGVLHQIVTFDHSMPDFLYSEKNHPEVARAVRSGAYEWAIGVKSNPNRWVWLDPVGLAPEKMVPFLVKRTKALHTMNETSKVIIVSPDVHAKDPYAISKINMPGFAWETMRLPCYGVLTDKPTMFGLR